MTDDLKRPNEPNVLVCMSVKIEVEKKWTVHLLLRRRCWRGSQKALSLQDGDRLVDNGRPRPPTPSLGLGLCGSDVLDTHRRLLC